MKGAMKMPNRMRAISTPNATVSAANFPSHKLADINNRNRQSWDSPATEVFNGVDPFGGSDQNAVVYQLQRLNLIQPVKVRIKFSSLVSQADGPPLNGNEMSCGGRTFPDVGHKTCCSWSSAASCGCRQSALRAPADAPMSARATSPRSSLGWVGPCRTQQR
jgi:hypothetical protein